MRLSIVVRDSSSAIRTSYWIADTPVRIFLNDRDIAEIGSEGQLRVAEGKPLRIEQCRREG